MPLNTRKMLACWKTSFIGPPKLGTNDRKELKTTVCLQRGSLIVAFNYITGSLKKDAVTMCSVVHMKQEVIGTIC